MKNAEHKFGKKSGKVQEEQELEISCGEKGKRTGNFKGKFDGMDDYVDIGDIGAWFKKSVLLDHDLAIIGKYYDIMELSGKVVPIIIQ